jgi:hypothetical protein
MAGDRPSRKPWAVLAYTVADDKTGASPLDTAAQRELAALCDAADFGQVSVAAQVDFKRVPGVYRGVLTAKPPRARGFQPIRAEDHPLWRRILGGVSHSTLRVEAERTDLNAARADVLREFVRFGRDRCPAERYVIFFYGHAYGPMGLFFDAEARRRQGNTLRLNDLASSMDAVDGRAAVVVFRDCFMNTLETACQLAPVADFMIASQSVVPVAGVWPWLGLMTPLLEGASSADVARALSVQLAQFLDTAENRTPFADVPYSLIDLDGVKEVVAPLAALTRALEDARQDPRRRLACARALEKSRCGFPDDASNPGDPALLDVPTLCAQLGALERDPVAGPARALGAVVQERVVRWHHAQTPRYGGIGLFYRPVSSRDRDRSYIFASSDEDVARDAEYYAALALSRATGWHRVANHPLSTARGA